MKPWGQQNTRCRICGNKTTQTCETAGLSYYEGSNTQARFFERLCSVCLYWSAFIYLDNGQAKVIIDA
jgi:hypothetical protein